MVKENGSFAFNFPYTDHLGSILTVTNASGAVIAEQNFDAWGRKRNVTTWDYASVGAVPDWLYRGYTGHEHLPEFGLINMNARLYDPVLGRMLSPDNYVGGGTQGFNRYAYANNNPLSYTDPSGNFIFAAVALGAIVGGGINLAIQNAKGNIHSPNDGWKAFGMGALGGALAAGGATTAIAGLYSGFASAISSNIPGIPIQIGNLSISISPAFIYGSAGFGIGLNANINFQIGDFSIGGSLGLTEFSSSPGTNKMGTEYRFSGSAGYDDGTFGVTLASNTFESGETSQRTGYLKLRHGDWSLSYENDGTPFQYAKLGDGYDSYRTAAASIGYLDYSLGMRLFTGRREYDNNCFDKNEIYGKEGYVGNPDINDYRAGILAFGYKGYSIGINNDKVRQVFQNKLAHDIIQKQAKIPNLPLAEPFFEYRTKNPFSHW